MHNLAKLLFVFSILPLLAFAKQPGNKISPEQYIALYKEDAIKGMEAYKIPASITLAQGMLESGNGNSDLAVKANNHFGIKCHSDWTGKTYIKDDDKKDECFRKYKSVLDSYLDHGQFLSGKSRYSELFELKITDYKGWAKGLKKAGYATNPHYPKRLTDIIEKYELNQYDQANVKSKKVNKQKEIKQVKKVKNETKTTIAKTAQREILRLGIKKYVLIQKGDTFYKIAKDTDKELWQLYKYNDLTANDKLNIGEKLFLQPKRNKANAANHLVKEGETMRYISQLYGIKLKVLYRKNYMEKGSEPKTGDTIYMQKSKPTEDF